MRYGTLVVAIHYIAIQLERYSKNSGFGLGIFHSIGSSLRQQCNNSFIKYSLLSSIYFTADN